MIIPLHSSLGASEALSKRERERERERRRKRGEKEKKKTLKNNSE